MNGAVEGWKCELRRYLGDEDTVGVLVPPAQVSSAAPFGTYHKNYNRDMKADIHRTQSWMFIDNSMISLEQNMTFRQQRVL